MVLTNEAHNVTELGFDRTAPKTLALVHLRASQINGCSFCVDSGSQHAQQRGESTQRLLVVSAWRDTPYFTDAERAALALTEAVTRLSDRADPVPDEIWNEAARHYGVLTHLFDSFDDRDEGPRA